MERRRTAAAAAAADHRQRHRIAEPGHGVPAVTFTANNVTNGSGANYNWEVRTEANALVASNGAVNLNPFVWNTTGACPATIAAA